MSRATKHNRRLHSWWGGLLLLSVLLASCSGLRPTHLPQIITAPSSDLARRCNTFFPQGKWQFTHAINFHLADGTNGNALGVLTIEGTTLNCALLSIEGLTLFEARSAEGAPLEIYRALPPFDSPSFAEGLIADIRTLFIKPGGIPSTGHLGQGDRLCRYTNPEEVTDIFPDSAGCFRLSTYDQVSATEVGLPVQTRAVAAHSCIERGNSLLARNLSLTGLGRSGYTLNLRLLTAEPLPAATP